MGGHCAIRPCPNLEPPVRISTLLGIAECFLSVTTITLVKPSVATCSHRASAEFAPLKTTGALRGKSRNSQVTRNARNL